MDNEALNGQGSNDFQATTTPEKHLAEQGDLVLVLFLPFINIYLQHVNV